MSGYKSVECGQCSVGMLRALTACILFLLYRIQTMQHETEKTIYSGSGIVVGRGKLCSTSSCASASAKTTETSEAATWRGPIQYSGHHVPESRYGLSRGVRLFLFFLLCTLFLQLS